MSGERTEFFYEDRTRGKAKVLFYAGLGVLAAYYLYELLLKLIGKRGAALSHAARPATQ